MILYREIHHTHIQSNLIHRLKKAIIVLILGLIYIVILNFSEPLVFSVMGDIPRSEEEKINGRYCLLHRRHTDIWFCFSDDLKHWEDHKKVMSSIPDSWNKTRIGIAGPPVLIDEGWFLIFHGVDENNHYRLGAALLDYKDPSKVLFRQAEPIIGPELSWEINGFIPNVIFSCATVLYEDRVYCCYGGADTVIGMAYIGLKDIKFD